MEIIDAIDTEIARLRRDIRSLRRARAVLGRNQAAVSAPPAEAAPKRMRSAAPRARKDPGAQVPKRPEPAAQEPAEIDVPVVDLKTGREVKLDGTLEGGRRPCSRCGEGDPKAFTARGTYCRKCTRVANMKHRQAERERLSGERAKSAGEAQATPPRKAVGRWRRGKQPIAPGTQMLRCLCRGEGEARCEALVMRKHATQHLYEVHDLVVPSDNEAAVMKLFEVVAQEEAA